MSDFSKNARVTVYINGQNAASELDKLEKKVGELKKKLNQAGKDTPLGKELKKEIRATNEELEKMRDKANLAGLSINQLEKHKKHLIALKNTITPGTAAFKEMEGRIKQVQARLTEVKSGLGPFAQAWQKVSLEAKAAAGVFAGSLIINQAGEMIQKLGELDDQLADLRKVTGMTDAQVKDLNASFSKFNTRTPVKQLRDLAYEAGKVGLKSKEDILEFVKAGDMIQVALGRDLGNEAIREIGKLTNIFKLDELYGIGDGMLKIASSINEVGAASSASEGYIVDFLKRTSGVAGIARVTAPELIGLAGTLDSLGQTSEVSSTAISKLLTKMGSEIETYAKLAGKSVDEFRDTMNRSGLEALLQVIENVGKTQGGLEQLSATLGDLGVDGGRIVGVFGTLASNIDEVRRQTGIATKEFEKNSSAAKEFELRNQSLGAVLANIRKDLVSTWQNNTVKGGVKDLVISFANLVKWVKENIEFFAALTKNIIRAAAIWGVYKLVIIASNLALKESTFLARALALAKSVLTRQITLSAAAMKGLNAIMRANPFLVILGAVMALDEGLKLLHRNTENQLRLERLRKSSLSDLTQLTNELTASQNALNGATERFNQLTEKQRQDTLKAVDAQINRMAIQRDQVQKQRDEAVALANQPTLLQKAKNKAIALGTGASEDVLNAKDAMANSLEVAKEYNEKLAEIDDRLTEMSKARNGLYKKQYAEQYGDDIEGKTINQLTEKINLYTEALQLATIGSEDYLRIQKKLQDAQKELNRIQSAGGSAGTGDTKDPLNKKEEQYKNAIQALKEYYGEGESLWKELLSTKTLSDEEIIEAERQKWQDLIILNRDGQAKLKAVLDSKKTTGTEKAFAKKKLEELLFQEAALQDQLSDAVLAKEDELAKAKLEKRQKLLDEINEVNLSEQEKELKRVKVHYDELLKIADSFNDPNLVMQVEEARQLAILHVQQKYAKIQEEKFKEQQARQQEIAIEAAGALLSVYGSFDRIKQGKEQEELYRIQNQNKKKQDNYQGLLNNHLITQDDYNDKSARLERDLRKKEFKIQAQAAKRQKTLNSFQIIIDTATSIVKTGAQLGYPQAIPFQITAGVIGAANLAAVLAEPVPKYEKGVIFGGSRHSSDPRKDGNPIIDRRTGRTIATVEAGEMLLSRAFVENNPELSRAALRVSQNEGGRRISPEEIFGRPSRIDVPGVQKALAAPQLRNGNYFPAEENSNRNQPSPADGSFQLIADKLDRLIDLNSRPSRTYLVKRDLEEMDEEDAFFKRYTEIQ